MTNTTFKVMDSFQLTLRYVYCLQQRAGRGPENEATPQVATLFLPPVSPGTKQFICATLYQRISQSLFPLV